MSFSIAALSPIDPSLNKVDPIHEVEKVNNNSNNPTPKPTELEQIAQLAETGTPLAVIATKLGLSLSEVEDRLGIKNDGTTQASAIAEASSRLSVTA